MKRAFAGLLFVLALGACQQRVTATVTRFTTLPPPPIDQSFAIVPDPAQAGNLEFEQTAARVGTALAGLGFHTVPPDRPADYAVFVRFGPAGARTEIIDYGPPMIGPYWRRPYPYYYPQYASYTLYAAFLEVDMLDGPAWRRGERKMAFQGRAVTETGIREFNVVIPYLVQALFDHFPGLNGETVHVVIPMP